MFRAIVLIHFVIFLNMCGSEDVPYAKIKQGVLRGKFWKTHQGRTFSGFTGIPFAQAPVGDLRFNVPVPAGAWKGVLDASKAHEACPQANIYTEDASVTGSEDCLYLNVYTPQLHATSERLLPVIVYFHGGSFLIGSARHDWLGPEILLDRNIVLVTANYRLGALGFLSTADEVAPGNNGLKDQNLALKWVKINIVHFGGDPDKVTIAGNSAGGASAHYHMLSALSRGVIAQSGTAINPFAISGSVEALNNAFKLGKFLHCSGITSRQLIACLKTIDAHEIVEQQAKLVSWDGDTTISPFRPVVEPAIDQAFLSEDPLDIMKSGRAADVPLMAGIVTQEGAYKAAGLINNGKFLEIFDRYFDMIVSSDFRIASDGSNASQALREFYFNRPIDNSTGSEFTDMYTDGWFLWGADKMARLHAVLSSQPVYLYLFEYHGSVSYSTLFGDPDHDYGVCHTDDLLYLLTRNHLFPNYIPTNADRRVSEVMTTLWENFAAAGNPTPEASPAIFTKWDPVQSGDLEYYHIRNYSDISMGTGLLLNRTEFWRTLPIEVIKTGNTWQSL